MVDKAPKAKQYFSEAFDDYDRLGITMVIMQFPKVKLIPILWKVTTPSCATTWLAWQDPPDVSPLSPRL